MFAGMRKEEEKAYGKKAVVYLDLLHWQQILSVIAGLALGAGIAMNLYPFDTTVLVAMYLLLILGFALAFVCVALGYRMQSERNKVAQGSSEPPGSQT
jgi:F0F1-type ATP synthase assembly protein I